MRQTETYLILDFLEKVCEDLFAIYGSRLKVDTLAGDFMTVFPKIRSVWYNWIEFRIMKYLGN